jgi:thiol-disulfide isomerase/thioredoxin
MTAAWLVLFLSGLIFDGVKVEFVSGNIVEKVGGYRPIRAAMDKSADDIGVAPEGLESPKYGQFEFGDKTWMFILDEPEEADAKLYIDTNGDGDLTNDPATDWELKDSGGQKMYQGKGQIDLGNGKLAMLGLYRFDPNDEKRAALANVLMYYADFGYEVTLTLEEQDYKSFVAGELSEQSRLSVDRDGNGRISSKRETVSIGKAFNFTGETFVLRLKEGTLSLDRAEAKIPMMPLPPDLSIGKHVIPFQATTMEGTEINFPESFDGKIVMLDFWATWCGPCIGEIPHMKKTYERWHDQGFEILGVSFDREDMEEKLNEFRTDRELPWRQIYEGKGWETTLGELYDVSAIPFVLLVDGSTGEILGTAKELRGPGLSKFVGEIIKKRNGDTDLDAEKDQNEEDAEDDGAEGK